MADSILGVNAFAMYTAKRGSTFTWNKTPSKMVYDPMLMALSKYCGNDKYKLVLVNAKAEIKKRMELMFVNYADDFDARNSGKNDVLKREEYYEHIFESIIRESIND